jgi:hypothetical protein
MNKSITILTIAFLLLGIAAKAQSPSIERYVVASAGGSYYNGTTFEMDYTLGEFAVVTLSDANNYLTQGFQQPFVDPNVSVNDNPLTDMNISYFPNPTSGNLTLNITNAGDREFKLELFDVLGQRISTQTATAGFNGTTAINIDMQHCTTGNYYLRISNGNDLVKNLKILKINN